MTARYVAALSFLVFVSPCSRLLLFASADKSLSHHCPVTVVDMSGSGNRLWQQPLLSGPVNAFDRETLRRRQNERGAAMEHNNEEKVEKVERQEEVECPKERDDQMKEESHQWRLPSFGGDDAADVDSNNYNTTSTTDGLIPPPFTITTAALSPALLPTVLYTPTNVVSEHNIAAAAASKVSSLLPPTPTAAKAHAGREHAQADRPRVCYL
eukprot:GHVS01045252.1.p1 GENE.GHVS01045252.1~~GHVS01045252.1.p1  ORF type:complete len:211 (-),score=50.37 GHVS01045252.1:640-1272(-)